MINGIKISKVKKSGDSYGMLSISDSRSENDFRFTIDWRFLSKLADEIKGLES